jgi:hypothetical protein
VAQQGNEDMLVGQAKAVLDFNWTGSCSTTSSTNGARTWRLSED